MSTSRIVLISISSAILFFTILFFIVFTFFIMFRNSHEEKVPYKARRIVRFDLANRKYYFTEGSVGLKKLFKNTKTEAWNDLSTFTDVFPASIQRMIYGVVRKLEKGSKHEGIKFDLPSKHFKNHVLKFKIYFDKINENDYLIDYEYNTFSTKEKKEKKVYEIERIDFANSKSPVKGAVSFNIKNDKKKNVNIFIKISSIFYPEKEVIYLKNKGSVSLVVYGETLQIVKKKIDKIIYAFIKRGYKRGIKQLYDGSAIAISSHIITLSRVNKFMQTLNYLLSQSINKNIPFVSHDDGISSEEFDIFVQGIKLFDKTIAKGNLDIKNSPVRKHTNNKKIIDYVFPLIPNLNRQLFDSIVRNENQREKLMNKFSNVIASREGVEKPVLVDVYSTWIIDNKNKIKNKNAIYVIHFKSNEDLKKLIDVIKELKNKGVICAVHISEYNENVATFIQATKPRFLIIDSAMWGKKDRIDSELYMKLLSLRKLVKYDNIKLIYQDPPKNIDETWVKEIGLEYTYTKK